MKVKNKIIFGSQPALAKLVLLSLPIKTSYEIAKLAKELKQNLELLNITRDKAIKRYGKQDETTKEVVLKPNTEEMTKFLEEFNALLEEEVEISSPKIKLPLKVDDKDFQLEPSVIIALEPFIDLER